MIKEIRLIEQSFVTLDYRTIRPLQGERKVLLPDAEKRLLNSLNEKGRFVPEYVWYNPNDGLYYTLDGHSRLKTYEKHGLTFNGSHELPFLLVQADNPKDAAEKLQIIDSDYGKVTREGQLAFADMFQLDVNWLNTTTMLSSFPDFDFINDYRVMQSNLSRDLLIPEPVVQTKNTHTANEHTQQTDDYASNNTAPIPNYPIQPATPPQPLPRASDDNYSNITEVIKYDYKIEYNNVINDIMKREGIDRREDAFIFMVRKFKEVYS